MLLKERVLRIPINDPYDIKHSNNPILGKPETLIVYKYHYACFQSGYRQRNTILYTNTYSHTLQSRYSKWGIHSHLWNQIKTAAL